MGNTVYAFATDGEYQAALSSVVNLEYDVLMNNNVNQYRSQSITVPANSSATRIVFETPVLSQMDSDVLCLDNISIMLPEQNGETLFIKSLDNYNSSAQPQQTIEEIQIKEKTTSVEIGDAPEKKESSNKVIVIVIVIVVLAVAGLVVFMIIRRHKKFY